MLTWEDCIAFSELTPEEIAAIAEHEHLPEVIAAELGNYLLHAAHGPERICRMIQDDIQASRQRGDYRHSAKLKLALKHFLASHPLEGAQA